MTIKGAITNRFLDLLAQKLAGTATPGAPAHIAVGSGQMGANNYAPDMQALISELDRVAIGSASIVGCRGDIAQFVSTFGAGVATGSWYEFGLFGGNKAETTLSTCESLTDWSTDTGNQLELTNKEKKQGTYSIQCSPKLGGTLFAVRFVHSTLNIDCSAHNTESFLRFWYNGVFLGLSHYIVVKLGNDASNYWQWTLSQSYEGWSENYLKIGDGVVVGSPVLASNLNYFSLVVNPAYEAPSFTDYIDDIVMVALGNMYARYELSTPITKAAGDSKDVYFLLKIA